MSTDVSELTPPKKLLRMLGAEGALIGGKGNPTGGRKSSPLTKGQVTQLQKLMAKGVGTSGLSYNIKVDGAWGPNTTRAWRDLCSKAPGANCQDFPNVKEANEVLKLLGVT